MDGERQRRKIRCEEYDRMVDLGLFQREHLELIRGELISRLDMDARRERRKIRREEYDRMVEAGLFQREHLELIRGELLTMSPVGIRHRIVVTQLYKAFIAHTPTHLVVCSQQPLICRGESEPEPDLSLVPFDPAPVRHPTSAALVVEVADSSLDYDLGDKAALYADSDVLEYWVIDLVDDVIHVHHDRVEGRWTSITRHARTEPVWPLAVPSVAVTLDDLLTPRP